MSSRSFPIHRAINRPLSFKGFKGPYILLAAIALVGDLFFFVLLYCCGVSPTICLLAAGSLGGGLLTLFRWCSKVYGVHGLEQRRVRRAIPRCWIIRSKKTIINKKQKQ